MESFCVSYWFGVMTVVGVSADVHVHDDGGGKI